MRKKKFDGSISEIMVAYQPNQELDFGPVRKMVEFQIKTASTACLWEDFRRRRTC